MGEHRYVVLRPIRDHERKSRYADSWGEVGISFSEEGKYPSLNTFPHNYTPDPGWLNFIGKDVVRSLAVLGAAVVLARNSDEVTLFGIPETAEDDDGVLGNCLGEVYIPISLPQWILGAIDKVFDATLDDVSFSNGISKGFDRGFQEGMKRGGQDEYDRRGK
jgi:hypothetical protein